MGTPKCYIIGAGISGLVAALELEKAGYAPVILEKTDSVGGRVKTDIIEGIPLDHGFQVLLSAYPAAKAYLNYEALDLKNFLPGAVIFRDGKKMELGDPLRHPAFGLSTLFSGAGTLPDKLKVFQLSRDLKNKSLDEIFQAPEKTTLTYLRDYGFSEQIIELFFTPFFAGIYLEPKLETSSRMFEFTYKMFSQGRATLPEKGIQAIPMQLEAQLQKTKIRFNTPVAAIEDDKIICTNGDRLNAERIIIATEPSVLLTKVKQTITWKKSTTIYYKVSHSILKRPIIGLISDNTSLVNNFHVLNDILPGIDSPTILSATIVRDNHLSDEDLFQRAANDLTKHTGLEKLTYFHHIHIPKALPLLNNVTYQPHRDVVRMSDTIFLAGDHLANGSLNAAMLSGALAANMACEGLH